MKSIFIYGENNILKNYKKAFTKDDCKCVISKQLPVTDDYDCLVLAGGGDVSPEFYGQKNKFCINVDKSRDKREFFLIEKFLSQNKKIVGICRGLQVLNVFFGGTLFQNVYYHSQVNGQDDFHFIYNKPNTFIYDLYGKNCFVNSAHHQAVNILGNGLKTASLSFDGYIEAFYHEKYPIYAVQFHPERMVNGNRLINFFLPWNVNKKETPKTSP